MCYFTLSLALYESCSAYTSLTKIGRVDLSHHSGSYKCIVVFHCGLTSIPLMLVTWSTVYCLYLPSYVFLVKCLFKPFWPIFNYWVLRVLYMPFMRHIICKYYHPSYSCSYHSLNCLIWRAEYFKSVKSNVSLCHCMDCTVLTISKKF